MQSVNLSRDAAAARAARVHVESYQIELDLSEVLEPPASGPHTFSSVTTVRFHANGAATFIDLRNAHDVTATLNGKEIDTSGYSSADGLPLTDLRAENELVVRARCEYTTSGEGLHRMVDPADQEVYLYSQFETGDAKRVFACFDQPDLKASFSFRVTAPAHWEVISNGATDTISAGPSTPNGTETKIHTFVETARFSTYLAALIAGPYHAVEDEYVDEDVRIPLRLLCRSSLAEYLDADRLFTETKQGFEFYHKTFGIPYPFGKYDQIFVPEYNMGAMENVGAVTFLEDYVFRSRVTNYLYERRNETILHEMAHMWFGNLVTMRWWDDLWLNESFATYASVLAQVAVSEYTEGWTTFACVEKSWAYRQDQLSSTHPIAADMRDLEAVERNFDGITYAKGAAVLKQLVAYVGLEPFLSGLRSYFHDHAYRNATFADLVAALETASGRDLSGWADQWLRTTGINALGASILRDDNGIINRLAIDQIGARPGGEELRTHRVGIGLYAENEAGDLVRTDYVEVDIDGESTPVPELEGRHAGDLVLINDCDLTYCTARLDSFSLVTAVEKLERITDSLARSLVWSTLWEMTRAAEMPARRYLQVVERASASEQHLGVLQKVLLQARQALTSYADPDWAAASGWPRFAEAMLNHARAAEPGSDRQLAFFTALTQCPLRPEHRRVLHDLLLDAPEAHGLAGLVVDTDLRWSILTALVAAGVLDVADIDAELERDNTASGARRAATARSALPRAEAKRDAVTLVAQTGAAAPSNAIVRATLTGLAFPGHEHLLSDVEEAYLETVDALWEARPGEIALSVVEGMFPAWRIDEENVMHYEAVIADQRRPAAQRRTIAERTDDLRRALAARRCDKYAAD